MYSESNELCCISSKFRATLSRIRNMPSTARQVFNIMQNALRNGLNIDVLYWLRSIVLAIRRKARVRAPGQTSKQNKKRISSTISSTNFWQKL